MTARTIRLSETLEAIHERPFHPDDVQSHRSIHRDELQTITDLLDISVDASPAVLRDYRAAIRTALDGLDNEKSADSSFSTHELRIITTAVHNSRRLSEADVLPVLEQCRDNNVPAISVNETIYQVTDYKEQRGIDAPGYEGYIAAIMDNYRLIAFYDWNETECYYQTGAALEQKTGHDPYLRWSRKDYVNTLVPVENDSQ